MFVFFLVSVELTFSCLDREVICDYRLLLVNKLKFALSTVCSFESSENDIQSSTSSTATSSYFAMFGRATPGQS